MAIEKVPEAEIKKRAAWAKKILDRMREGDTKKEAIAALTKDHGAPKAEYLMYAYTDYMNRQRREAKAEERKQGKGGTTVKGYPINWHTFILHADVNNESVEDKALRLGITPKLYVTLVEAYEEGMIIGKVMASK